MMKRFVSLLFLCMTFAMAMSQKLTVDNFALAPRDLTGSTQPRNDNNGVACALVKVQLARPGATFHGNVMGDTPYSQSVYMVYMMKGSKMLEVRLDGYLPVMIDFEKDWGINGVESLSTYVLSITLPNVIGQSVDDGMSYFTLTVMPKNASVLLDGDLQALNEEGVLSLRLPRGRHSYRIVARGYAEKTKSFNLGAERLDLAEKLESSKAALSVTCATSGADIYINDEKKGNTSWNGTIAPGNYLIEARKEGFITQQRSVTLSDNQSLKVDLPALMASVGQLDINYMPVNAEVVIDGEKKGTSPNLFKNLTVGSHHVEIRKEGYQNETKTVTIAEGQTASLSGSLVAVASSTSSLDAKAMYNMGNDYYYGRNGKTKDYAEAVKWYRKAAEQGYADGQNDLGYMYRKGLGVTQDYAEAVKWYRKAAEQGNASGQNNLGYMYDEGLGVPQDYAEAVKWYRKAAEQGKAYGQYDLGMMYYNGTGVPKDLNEAKKWFQKAAAQGHEGSKNMLEKL